MPSPADLYLSRSSLVFYAQLGETSGTTATDSKGSSNGTYSAGVTLANVVGAVPGSKAPTFNGTSGDISVPDVAALGVGDQFTISVWLKLSATTGSGQFAVATKNANAWQLAYDPTNHRYCMNVDSQGGDLVFSNTNGVNDTNWHHVFMTKNGSTRAILIDTVDQTNLGTNVASQSNAFEMRIGSNQGVNSWFPGSMQHLAIYNTALTAVEAQQDYDISRAPFAPYPRRLLVQSPPPRRRIQGLRR